MGSSGIAALGVALPLHDRLAPRELALADRLADPRIALCERLAGLRIDDRIAAAGAAPPPWTPHDLRRTAATRMAEDLQVQPHVIEAILNHVSGHKHGVAGIYNLATYAAEKDAALSLWADHVAAIVEGRRSNVVTLKRG